MDFTWAVKYATEFLGTAILIILGNGAVANVELKGTKGHQSGWLVIAVGYGMGAVSYTHLKALRLAMERLELLTRKTSQMKSVIRQALLEYPDIFVFSGEEDFAPHILTFGIKGVRGEVIVHAFEDYDIFISTTSACSSKAGKPAGTLIAMGVEKDKAQSAVRVSLDLENDMSQVEQFLTKLKLIYNQTRKVR